MRFEENNVFITVPAYDVFDKNPMVVSEHGKKYKIMYYKYVFEIDSKLSENKIIVYDRFDKNWAEIPIFKITLEQYKNVSRVMNRKKMLREEYRNMFQGPLQFIYNISKSDFFYRKCKFENLDELGKVKAGLEWLQSYIIHTPKDRYLMHAPADKIFRLACESDKKMNCRNMAVVLNTIYTNLLLKSRYIICLQKEDKIDDSHFVVEVYISNWNKWILVDSSYGLLFRADGVYLSLAEVRRLVAQDAEINIESINYRFSPDLYWRNFIKKMYRFRRPLIITDYYDAQESFVELVPNPNDYTCNEKNFLIDNPDLFWEM